MLLTVISDLPGAGLVLVRQPVSVSRCERVVSGLILLVLNFMLSPKSQGYFPAPLRQDGSNAILESPHTASPRTADPMWVTWRLGATSQKSRPNGRSGLTTSLSSRTVLLALSS